MSDQPPADDRETVHLCYGSEKSRGTRGGHRARREDSYGHRDWNDAIVDVPPGTYRFIHHTGERSFDHDAVETVIFARVDRIA